jgi:hypothetical protein
MDKSIRIFLGMVVGGSTIAEILARGLSLKANETRRYNKNLAAVNAEIMKDNETRSEKKKRDLKNYKVCSVFSGLSFFFHFNLV